MPTYAILQINITNKENYKEYLNQVTKIVTKHQGEYIIRGGKSEVVLGKWNYQRTVVVKFPSYDAAEKCYKSPPYQKAWSLAKNSTERNFQIIEGV